MSSNNDENTARGLSTDQLRDRVDRHYDPCAGENGQWYRCQRDTENGTRCNSKVYFPTGVLAHENHHSIASGDGSLLPQDHGRSTSEEIPDEQTPTLDTSKDSPTDEEILEDIYSDFE